MNAISNTRIVNRSGLAEIMGVSLPTVDSWRKAGCPVLTTGGRGREWEFDLSVVVEWRCEMAARAAAGERGDDEDELKRRKLKAEAEMLELELAEKKKLVAPVEQMGKMMSHVFAEVRAGIRNLPTRCVSQLIGETDPRRFKRVMLDEIDTVLEALATTDLTDGYTEGGADGGDEKE